MNPAGWSRVVVVVCLGLMLGAGVLCPPAAWAQELIIGEDAQAPGSQATDEGEGDSAYQSRAGIQPQRGDTRRRMVYKFDFEEHKFGNFESLPMNWFAVGRRADTSRPNFLNVPLHRELVERTGFPAYCHVGFNRPQTQRDVNHTLMLRLDGGNAGAFLEVGTIAATPSSDYVITARVRTSVLEHARARMTALFVDDKGQAIEESEVRSRLINTHGEWSTVTLKLMGDFRRAAWIVMQVELLQPDQQSGQRSTSRRILYTDVKAEAEFDDITVWQVPRIIIETQSPVNVIREPQRPRMNITVRDLTGQPLAADVTIYDENHRKIAHQRRLVGDGQPRTWEWDPKIERFGWYLVDLIVRDQSGRGQTIARNLGTFLYLPDEPTMHMRDARRFGVDATGVEHAELLLFPQLMQASLLRAATISIWDTDTTSENLDYKQQIIDRHLFFLERLGVEVTLSLHPLPKELLMLLEADEGSTMWALSQDRTRWFPYVSPFVMHNGQRIRRWRIGSPEEPSTFFMPELEELLESVNTTFQGLAPQPRVLLPWSIHQSRHPALYPHNVLSMQVPASVVPAYIPEHLDTFLSANEVADAIPVELHLEEYTAAEISQRRRIDSMAKRMIFAWEAQVDRMHITRPWTSTTGRDRTLIPDPLLGVFAQVAHRLAGRRVVGELSLGPGLRCKIFDGPSGGMLVIWNESAPDQDARMDMYLGEKPEVVDVWGNRMRLEEVNNRHQVQLSRTPIFIEGIDANLARFRASFRIEPPVVESIRQPHMRTITVTNPWPRTIAGHFVIRDPEHWQITPRQHIFAIAPGQTRTFPVQLVFPASEVSGEKELGALFVFDASRSYAVHMAAPFELGLENLNFEATLSLRRNPQTGKTDAIVTHLVTNTGSEDLSLYAFARLDGHPRQERIISALKPGQTVVRRFIFEDAMPQLRQGPIRTGLRQTGGPAVLNKVLGLDDP